MIKKENVKIAAGYRLIVIVINKKTRRNLGDGIYTRVHLKPLLPELNVQRKIELHAKQVT